MEIEVQLEEMVHRVFLENLVPLDHPDHVGHLELKVPQVNLVCWADLDKMEQKVNLECKALLDQGVLLGQKELTG